MSLKNYLECAFNKFQLQVQAMATSSAPVEKGFECELCGGDCYLVKTIRYSRFKTPSQFLKRGSGADITAAELEICPACGGTGVNQEKAKAFIAENKAKGIAA